MSRRARQRKKTQSHQKTGKNTSVNPITDPAFNVIEQTPYPPGYLRIATESARNLDRLVCNIFYGILSTNGHKLESTFNEVLSSATPSMAKLERNTIEIRRELENVIWYSNVFKNIVRAFSWISFISVLSTHDWSKISSRLEFIACDIFILYAIIRLESDWKNRPSLSRQITQDLNGIFNSIEVMTKSHPSKIVWRDCRFDFSKFNRCAISIILYSLKKFDFKCFRQKKEIIIIKVDRVLERTKLALQQTIKSDLNAYETLLKFIRSFNASFSKINIQADIELLYEDSGITFRIRISKYFSIEEQEFEIQEITSFLPDVLKERAEIVENELLLNIIGTDITSDIVDALSDQHLFSKINLTALSKTSTVSVAANDEQIDETVDDQLLSLISFEGDMARDSSLLLDIAEEEEPRAPSPHRLSPTIFQPEAVIHEEAVAHEEEVQENSIIWVNPEKRSQYLVYKGEVPGTLAYLGENDLGELVYCYFPRTTKDYVASKNRHLVSLFERAVLNGYSNNSGKRIGTGIVEQWGTFLAKIHGDPRLLSSTILQTTDRDGRHHNLVILDTLELKYHQNTAQIKRRKGPTVRDATPDERFERHDDRELERTVSSQLSI